MPSRRQLLGEFDSLSIMVPRDSTQETTTDMFPHISDDDKFLLIALVLALFFGLFWWWNRSAKKWLEDNGRGGGWLARETRKKTPTPQQKPKARVSETGGKGPSQGA